MHKERGVTLTGNNLKRRRSYFSTAPDGGQFIALLLKLLNAEDDYRDADKANLENYHERLLRPLRVGGVIVCDTTLWGGTVTLPDPPRQFTRKDTIEFDKMIAGDPRFDISQVALGEGMTICGRVYRCVLIKFMAQIKIVSITFF